MTSRGFSFATRQQQLVTLTLHTYAPPVTLPLLSHPTHKRNVRRSLFFFARRAPRAAASNHLLLIIVFVV